MPTGLTPLNPRVPTRITTARRRSEGSLADSVRPEALRCAAALSARPLVTRCVPAHPQYGRLVGNSSITQNAIAGSSALRSRQKPSPICAASEMPFAKKRRAGATGIPDALGYSNICKINLRIGDICESSQTGDRFISFDSKPFDRTAWPTVVPTTTHALGRRLEIYLTVRGPSHDCDHPNGWINPGKDP
jgi:hypothetical protein